MLVRRTLGGLALIGWLGGQYLGALLVGKLWTRPARAWRRWLDRHGSRLFVAHVRAHGGLLIKIGQFIAMRPDFFPLAYVDACAPLRDQAPARPFPVIRAALDHVFEGRVEAHFARIEPEPIAAASFGQVHRAWLADGTLVALKVQYPGLGAMVDRDLALTRLALRLFALALPGWPLDEVYREILRTSREEQDYLHEAAGADRLREGLARHGISVPAVRWEHTREKALTMEFAPGETFARMDLASLPAAERRRLAGALIDGFLHMLLEASFFHADPHAGNLLYDTSTTPARLWLIDFGMTATLSRSDSELYRRFLERVRANDTDGMVDVLTELGFVLPHADRARLKALAREVYDSVAHLKPEALKGSSRQAEVGAKVNEFLRRIDGLAFPQHTLLLSRATSLIEGVCMRLTPDENILDLIRPRIRAALPLRAKLERLRDEIVETWRELRALPGRMEAAVREREPVRIAPIVSAILLVAALQLDRGPWRTWSAVAAGVALVVSLRRR